MVSPLFDRVRNMRASFVKDFPGLAPGLPSLNYEPTLDREGLPNESLDRRRLASVDVGLGRVRSPTPEAGESADDHLKRLLMRQV